MNKICTSIEQSKKLLELGIDVNTADMSWQNNEFPIGFNDDDAVPAWSLTVLLGVLPSSSLDSSNDHYYRLHCMERFTEWYDNPIDAAFEMICRLKENDKI